MKLSVRPLANAGDDLNHTYEIVTSLGMTVSILELGASIQKIAIRSRDGSSVPVALGSPDMEFYRQRICYSGATLAPNAGRIRDGHLPVYGKDFQLALNDGPNQLHGGPHNLSGMVWSTDSTSCDHDMATVCLSASQPDGCDGYPGNRHYQVRYSVEDTNWITIEYRAWTDTPTYINMSSHTYWNLSGDFSRPALSQELMIPANSVCLNDEAHLPFDIAPVSGTPFDFRKPRTLASALESSASLSPSDSAKIRGQLTIARGYNHAYLLNKNRPFRTLRTARRHQPLKKAAILCDPVSGRTLKMMTDAPALVLYSGGFLPDGLPLHESQPSCPSCAIALEAQDLPDVMHLLPDYYTLTTPEQPFSRIIRFHVL